MKLILKLFAVTLLLASYHQLSASEVVEGQLMGRVAPSYYDYDSCSLKGSGGVYNIINTYSHCEWVTETQCSWVPDGHGGGYSNCTPHQRLDCRYRNETYSIGDVIYKADSKLWFRSETGTDVQIGTMKKRWWKWTMYTDSTVFGLQCGNGFANAILK